jgi:hypothetical protein
MNESHRFGRTPLSPEPIRSAQAQLVPIMKATGPPWVLSGSCSLALHDMQVEPHDVDISRTGTVHTASARHCERWQKNSRRAMVRERAYPLTSCS